MNFKRLLDTKGLSFWLLASAIGLNLIYMVILLIIVNLSIGGSPQEGGSDMVQVIALLACLIGPFLVAWIITGMAGDGRGPTYGVYGSFGAAVPLVLLFIYSRAIFLLLMVGVVLAGGLNGGIFAEAMRNRHG
jgi:hypothetical protein